MKYIKWNVEKAFTVAKKYKTRSGFSKQSSRAYEILRENDLLYDACKHMILPYGTAIKWDKNKCQKIALKYEYRMDFQSFAKKAYEAAKNHKWLNEICQHMKYKKLPNGHWNNIENCKKEALKYEIRKEFIKKCPHVYVKSLKMGWIDEICKHMIVVGDRYNRCIYSYEFPDNHVYVGLTCNLTRRQYDRNSDKNDAVTKYINNTGLIPIRKQLTDYIPVVDAIKKECEILNEYVNDGWISLNKCKTGGIGSYSITTL